MTVRQLTDENGSDDAEAQLASQVGERGDEIEGKAAESLKNETLRLYLPARYLALERRRCQGERPSRRQAFD